MCTPALACPSCLSVDAAPLYRVDGFHYVRCTKCRSARLDPPPPDPLSLYEAGYFQQGAHGGYADYEADEALHRRNARRRMRLLRSIRPAPGSILDVGCATGFFPDECERIGWKAEGVEPSPWARPLAARRIGANVFPTLDQVPTDRRYDALTFFQVLEHTPDPDQSIADARARVAEGAALIIETWDLESRVARAFGQRWQQVTPPSVIHLFTRDSLTALLTRHGFGAIRFVPTTKTVSVGFVTRLLAGKSPLLAPLGVIARAPGLSGVPLRYSLGDLVTVLAVAS